MPITPPGKEPLTQQLGHLLRQARGSRHQADVARAAGFSVPMLSRFERGQHVPTIEQAARLDEVVNTGTVIQNAAREILLNPTRTVFEFPRTWHVFSFRPEYIGPVYVHLVAPDEPLGNVQVELRWGMLRRAARLPEIDAEGVALVCAKISPDPPPPLRVTTSVSLLAVSGAGMPMLPDDRVLDWTEGWHE